MTVQLSIKQKKSLATSFYRSTRSLCSKYPAIMQHTDSVLMVLALFWLGAPLVCASSI